MSTATARAIRRGARSADPLASNYKPPRGQKSGLGYAFNTKRWTRARLRGIHDEATLYVMAHYLRRLTKQQKEQDHA